MLRPRPEDGHMIVRGLPVGIQPLALKQGIQPLLEKNGKIELGGRSFGRVIRDAQTFSGFCGHGPGSRSVGILPDRVDLPVPVGGFGEAFFTFPRAMNGFRLFFQEIRVGVIVVFPPPGRRIFPGNAFRILREKIRPVCGLGKGRLRRSRVSRWPGGCRQGSGAAAAQEEKQGNQQQNQSFLCHLQTPSRGSGGF